MSAELDALVAACHDCATDPKAAKSTQRLASTLGAWAPTVSAGPQPPEPQPTPLGKVDSWAYDNTTGNGQATPAPLVQQLCAHVESTDGSKAVSDAHGSATVSWQYFDPFRRYYDVPGWTDPIFGHDSEDWWLHKPGSAGARADRIVASYNGTTHAYLLNPLTAAVQAWLYGYAKQTYGSYSGLFIDDCAPNLSLAVYGSGVQSSREITTDAQWQAAVTGLLAAFTAWRLDVNSFYANPSLPVPLWLLDLPGVVGGLMEQTPVSGQSMVAPDRFAHMLDVAAQVAAKPGGYLRLHSNGIAATDTRWRLVHAASVLLCWQPGRVVSFTDYQHTAPALQVYPESQLALPAPLTPGPVTIAPNAPNVWVRDFATSNSHLRAIVNAGSTPYSLSTSFPHQVTLLGGTVEEGGTLGTGPAPATLAPQTAAILTA